MFANGEFDVATLYFSEFKSVIAQKPTALQLIPAKLPERKGQRSGDRRGAVYEYEPDEETILELAADRATSRRRSSAGCSRTPRPSRARA